MDFANVGIFVRTSKPATPADACAGFQRTVVSAYVGLQLIVSPFFFQSTSVTVLKAEDRFVQVPPCAPALTSPASNDEQVNGNTFKWERSLV